MPALLLVALAATGQTLDQGMRYLEIEQFAKAEQTFKQLAQAKPSDDNSYYLGYYYLRTEQPEQAKGQFDQVLGRNPKHALSHTGMVGYNLLTGKSDKVNYHAEEAKKLTKSRNGEVLYRLGEAYIMSEKTNSPADALNNLDAAIALEPKKAEFYIVRGTAYRLKGEGGKAMGDFTQAQNLKPSWGMPYMQRGRVMEAARNYTEAAKIYNEGIEKDPGFSLLHKELAEVYFLARRYDQAADSYKKYVENIDKNPDVMLQYAAFLIEAGKHSDALNILQQVPEDATMRKARALAYSQNSTKQYAEGLANMGKYWNVTAEDKRTWRDYDVYGDMLLNSGQDTMKAVQYYVAAANKRLATGADRDSTAWAETVRKQADMLKAGKRFDSAARYYSMLARSSKGTTQDWISTGQAYNNAKNYQQADTTFGSAIARYPDTPYLLYWKAFNMQKMGGKDAENSYGWYKRFVDANPDPAKYKPFIVFSLKALSSYHGTLYGKSKSEAHRKAAEDYLKRILAIDANDKYAQENLKALAK